MTGDDGEILTFARVEGHRFFLTAQTRIRSVCFDFRRATEKIHCTNANSDYNVSRQGEHSSQGQIPKWSGTLPLLRKSTFIKKRIATWF